MSKKLFIGKVVSNKMTNTIVVAIDRKVPHPRYGKLITHTKRLLVDTNGIEVKIGEMVKIEEIKPMSKNKNFKVVEKVDKFLRSSSDEEKGTAGLKNFKVVEKVDKFLRSSSDEEKGTAGLKNFKVVSKEGGQNGSAQK